MPKILELHYDMSGNGTVITIHRMCKRGYIGRTYKYTQTRADRVIIATPPPQWTTRTFYNPYHTVTTQK